MAIVEFCLFLRPSFHVVQVPEHKIHVRCRSHHEQNHTKTGKQYRKRADLAKLHCNKCSAGAISYPVLRFAGAPLWLECRPTDVALWLAIAKRRTKAQ